MASWRVGLTTSPQTAARDARPSRKAFQWAKGPAGWNFAAQASPDADDQFPDEDADEVHDEGNRGEPLSLISLPGAVGGGLAPRCEQGSVDLEGRSWGSWWCEGEAYQDLGLQGDASHATLPEL